MSGVSHLSFTNQRKLQNDVIFQTLKKEWQHDALVQSILENMLPAMAKLLQRIFTDHLEGGKWIEVSPEIRERCKGLPKHNKFSESIFGHLDRILREKPSISTIAAEAYIMFSHNRTLEWLQKKNAKEKEQLLSAARKEVKVVKSKFKDRVQAIKESQKEALLAKIKKSEELKAQRLRKKEQQTNDIVFWGLWQNDQQVESALREIQTTKQKVAALKAQLHFRNNVLHQKPDNMKGVYSVTKLIGNKRVNLTPEELTMNLKKLIQHSFEIEPPTTTDEQIPLLVGKNIRHKFNDSDGGSDWYNGKVISVVKLLIFKLFKHA